jgi:RNA polymerase-binding transcription factor DksA
MTADDKASDTEELFRSQALLAAQAEAKRLAALPTCSKCADCEDDIDPLRVAAVCGCCLCGECAKRAAYRARLYRG